MTATAERDLPFAGPGVLAELVRSRQIRPRELVELCVSRIERLDPQLNAFRVVLADQALAACNSLPEGPLRGVPIAIKDDTPVAGQATTRGSRSHGPAIAADAEVVRRLRAAGAIPIGITNVPELTIFPWTASHANGVTANPWNPARTPGGSSGGSAAAVASGMVPAATGSDGGGSIRIPAACCGLVGMKPSRGRVPWAPGSEGWLGLATYGPLARTVADSALLLSVMAGTTLPELTPPERLRIAISRRVPAGAIASVSVDQRGAWESTAALLSDLGHEVVERHPDYGLAGLEFLQTWLRGIYESSLDVPVRSLLEPTTRQMAGLGRVLVPPRRRRSLLAKRAATTARVLALWDEFDVLLTPGLTVTAIRAEGAYGKPAPLAINVAGRFTPFTPIFNLTGQPAIALPAGTGSDGMPLSVQLVGRPGAEALLYQLGAQIEEARPWAQIRPPVV